MNGPTGGGALGGGDALDPGSWDDEDWERFAASLKRDLDLTVCRHTETSKGLLGGRWGCDRKKRDDDLCENASSNLDAVVARIEARLGCGTAKAEDVLQTLVDKGLVTHYRCKAVFFRV